MPTPNDTTTTLSLGTQDGAVMDESLVTQSDGITEATRPRVVAGYDNGDLVDDAHPMPVLDSSARRINEREQLMAISKLTVNFGQSRHRERLTVGDRFDQVDRRGPGGR